MPRPPLPGGHDFGRTCDTSMTTPAGRSVSSAGGACPGQERTPTQRQHRGDEAERVAALDHGTHDEGAQTRDQQEQEDLFTGHLRGALARGGMTSRHGLPQS